MLPARVLFVKDDPLRLRLVIACTLCVLSDYLLKLYEGVCRIWYSFDQSVTEAYNIGCSLIAKQ